MHHDVMKLSPADIANIEAMLQTGAFSDAEAVVQEALQSHRQMTEALQADIEAARSEPSRPADIVFAEMRARLEARLASDRSG